jgi:hypothetical protein
MKKTKGRFSEDLLSDFRENALVYGESLEIGDSKTANIAAGNATTLKKRIMAEGSSSISKLLNLLDDGNPWVRYAAAAITLDINAERAYSVLRDLETRSGTIGASAYTVLRMWESGAQL